MIYVFNIKSGIIVSLMLTISSLCFALHDGDTLIIPSERIIINRLNTTGGSMSDYKQALNSSVYKETNSKNIANNTLFLLQKIKSEFHLINGFGFKLGFTTNEYGWSHPDPFLTKAYRQPSNSTASFSTNGDFFKFNLFSTLLDIGFLWRKYNFEYDAVDSYGNIIDVKTTDNSVFLISISLCEKIEYSIKSWGFYAYAGPRGDFKIGKSIKPNFQNVFDNLKHSNFGLTTGMGIDYGPGRKFIFSLEFYYDPDFTKTFTSDSGFIKNSEFGIKLGVGFIFKRKQAELIRL